MFNLTPAEKIKYMSQIEIDITQDCNMSCVSCVRGCDKFKSNIIMEPDQVQHFVDMSYSYPWSKVGLMGGEVTTHSNLDEILEIMYQFTQDHPSCHVWTMTNGLIDYDFPPWLEVVKNTNHDHHAFYVSPKDVNYPMDKRLCHVMTDCGLGYSVYGFTPCCNTSSIIRAFNLVDGIQHIKHLTYENVMRLCNQYCKYCGWYMMDSFTEGHLLTYPVKYMSQSWKEAYRRYNNIR